MSKPQLAQVIHCGGTLTPETVFARLTIFFNELVLFPFVTVYSIESNLFQAL